MRRHYEGHNGRVTTPALLPSRLSGASGRIPLSLADLSGPATGEIHLPLRLAWSGPTTFDVADAGQRLTLYRALLDCSSVTTSSGTCTPTC